MGKDTSHQESSMAAAMEIGEKLDGEMANLQQEGLKQAGYRAGLLHSVKMLEGYSVEVDQLFAEDKVTNEGRILIKNHLNAVGARIAKKLIASKENEPGLAGQVMGVTRAMKVVAAFHDRQEQTAIARKASAGPKEKRERAQATVDKRKERRARQKGLKLDTAEVAPPSPASAPEPEPPAEDPEPPAREPETPDNVVQLPVPVDVSDKEVNRYVRKRKLPVLRSEAEFLGLPQDGGRRELARRILEHRKKAG